MNTKKIFSIILVLAIIGGIIYFISTHITVSKNEDENYMDYTPEQEISDKQLRETTITLYFLDSSTGELKSEGRQIDANELLKNPYKTIVQKLIDGPKDEKLQSVFPENTRLIDANFADTCVTLNFSDDLLNFEDDTQKYNIVNSILNSLTQLNEVNSVKILVNNETSDQLDQEYSVISENT